MKRHLTLLLPVVAALIFVVTHFRWSGELPERVATHFDASGQPNGWMSRSGHGRFILGVGLGTAGFIMILCHAIRFFPPSLLNVPNSAYWRSPGHFPEACQKIAVWGNVFAAGLLAFFTALNGQVTLANRKTPPVLDGSLLGWSVGGFVLLTIGMGVFLVYRFAKPAAR